MQGHPFKGLSWISKLTYKTLQCKPNLCFEFLAHKKCIILARNIIVLCLRNKIVRYHCFRIILGYFPCKTIIESLIIVILDKCYDANFFVCLICSLHINVIHSRSDVKALISDKMNLTFVFKRKH